jgi:uncharacterized protein (TIGR02246 family)
MTDDERAIQDLVATWMKASESGDVQTVMSLMADDVIFMVPGREPFGKDAFRAALETIEERPHDGNERHSRNQRARRLGLHPQLHRNSDHPA